MLDIRKVPSYQDNSVLQQATQGGRGIPFSTISRSRSMTPRSRLMTCFTRTRLEHFGFLNLPL